MLSSYEWFCSNWTFDEISRIRFTTGYSRGHKRSTQGQLSSFGVNLFFLLRFTLSTITIKKWKIAWALNFHITYILKLFRQFDSIELNRSGQVRPDDHPVQVRHSVHACQARLVVLVALVVPQEVLKWNFEFRKFTGLWNTCKLS